MTGARQTADGAAADLLLPDIVEGPNFGSWVARGAVGVTLASLVVFGALTLLVLFTLRLDVALDASGYLEPRQVHAVRSPLAGVVREVMVAAGDEVGQGQMVARLDSFELENRLAGLELEADLKRHQPDTDRRQFQMLQEEIRGVEDLLARHVLVSPGDGVILTERLDDLIGTRVAAGELVLEVGSAGSWQAELWLPEQDIHLVEEGDLVKLRVRAITTLQQWRHRVFDGRVRYVGRDALADRPGYYRVVAELDGVSVQGEVLQRFRRGMSVEASIVTRSARAIDLLVRYIFQPQGA